MISNMLILGVLLLASKVVIAASSSPDMSIASPTIARSTGVASAANGIKSACASVSSMSSAYISMFPSATAALVPAKAAEDCLRSVPVNVEEDKALIEEMQYYINWQSNMAYFSEPPEGYKEERSDVSKGLKNISDTLSKGSYQDEFSVMYDVYLTITKAYDFHFSFTPDIMAVFLFRRGNVGKNLQDEFALVSISADAKSTPQLYNYYDIMYPSAGWTASPVVEINNQSAEAFVQDWSTGFVYNEDHARYNYLFPNQAGISTGKISNQFGRTAVPLGNDYTRVKYENGTQVQYINTASVPLNMMDGIDTGIDFFDAFCNRGPPKEVSSNKKRHGMQWAHDEVVQELAASKVMRDGMSSSATPTATGYPQPERLHSEAIVGGYYLSDSGYEDVAVLSIPSFWPQTEGGGAEFQDLIGDFIQGAATDGKKKLVIDLRGNGGGLVFLGYDAFKQLFPSLEPYGSWRLRANEALGELGEVFNDMLSNHSYQEAIQDFMVNGNNGYGALWSSIFNYRVPVTTDNKNFSSWNEFFGPKDIHNENYTTLARLDLNNFFSDDLNMDVTGYRTRANKLDRNQPFEAANIVLLQDGGCGSTCALFTEFMKTQSGVRQIVVGGKPESGTMQGVSGSKGAQNLNWNQVLSEAQKIYRSMPDREEELNKTEVGKLLYSQRPLNRVSYSSDGTTHASINLRDHIRMNDTTNTPLEFVYEAADCRLFYTADMIRDPRVLWKKTVDAHFGDAKSICVEGSVGDKTALSGGAWSNVSKQAQHENAACVVTATHHVAWMVMAIAAAAAAFCI